MKSEVIMAIRTGNRRENADAMQKVLTKFGCSIKMRLGLHEAEHVCSDEGLILLQLANQPEEIEKLKKALDEIEGVRFKTMEV